MIQTLKLRLFSIYSDTRFADIIKGTTWTFIARVLSTGMGLIISVIVARHYGADVVGILAVINSMLMFTTLFTVFGTNTSILSLIPEHLIKFSPTSAFLLYRKTHLLVIIFSLITAILLFFTSKMISTAFISKPHINFCISLTSFFIIFKAIALLSTEAVRALKLIRFYAIMHLLPTLSNLILLILIPLWLSDRNVPIYAFLISLIFTSTAGMIIVERTFKRLILPTDQIRPVSSKEIVAFSWPMFLAASMALIITQTGVFILGIYRSEAEVGYYAISMKISILTSFVITSINSMVAPKFSELFHSNNISELFYVAKKSSKLIFWTTTPILLVLIILGKQILTHIFSAEFTVAYSSLLILTAGQFVNSICGSTGIFMNMTGNQKEFRNILAAAAVLNIVLNILLIPNWGIVGSASASAFSIAFWNILTLFYIKRKFGKTIGYFPIFSDN